MQNNPLCDAYTYHRKLGKPASAALALARADMASGKARYPSSLCNPWNPRFSAHGERHLRWIENTDRAGLRFVGFADEILGLRHNGWYTNEFQDETYRGAVYQMAARQGESIYVYGYDDPCNRKAALLSFDYTNDKEDAARWADSFAEHSAEEERKYNEASSARLAYDEAAGELAELRRKLLALCRELRDERNLPAEICATLREAIASKWERRNELHRERAELAESFAGHPGWRDV